MQILYFAYHWDSRVIKSFPKRIYAQVFQVKIITNSARSYFFQRENQQNWQKYKNNPHTWYRIPIQRVFADPVEIEPRYRAL